MALPGFCSVSQADGSVAGTHSGYALLLPPLRTAKASLINMVLNMCLLDFDEVAVDGKV